MYKRYWYTKERNLWIQVNSFKQKTSPPPLPPIFPVFSPVFCDSAIGPCSNLVEPSLFGTNLLKQRMLRDLWRTSAVFAPDSLNKQLSTQFCSGGSKMKSNLKIPKKKNVFISFISFKTVWVGFIVFRSGHFLGIPNGSGDLQTLYSQVCILCRWEIVRWNAQPWFGEAALETWYFGISMLQCWK